VYRYESHGHSEASYCLAAFRLLSSVCPRNSVSTHVQIHIENMMELNGLQNHIKSHAALV